MSEEWRTNPMYGGMSEEAAKCSHEAWVRNGKQLAGPGKDVPKTDKEIALFKRQIEVQLDEYEQALRDYAAWLAAWRARRPQGFRCKQNAIPNARRA